MRWLGLDRLWRAALRRLMFLWVRVKVLPEEAQAPSDGAKRDVVYVLERESTADFLVLDHYCLGSGRNRPGSELVLGETRLGRSWLPLRLERGWRYQRHLRRQNLFLQGLIGELKKDPERRLTLVPVAVYWGRSPEKERSLLRALLSEDWAIAGRLRRFFSVIVHGRDTLMQLSPPLELSQLVAEGASEALTARKLQRILRAHYRRLRVATIGPDLSHRRTMVTKLLETREVRRAIEREMRSRKVSRRRAVAKAREYANEIAANYSYRVIRVAEMLLSWLWQRLYDGIELNNFDRLKAVVEGNEVVYVPCHRSHIDYLLLSYVLYHRGLVVPHIAAGINLNLPLLGAFLRGGGAFFLRRSFRGNQLYSAVFNQYLAMNLAKGVPIEYFIEGGRSRTGRPLPPRPGMLSMTVSNFLAQHRRPLVFVPVYFGYERIVEARTYLGELSGQPKRRESVLGLLSFLPTLKERFGRVFVNFGEPLFLDERLEQERPGWRDLDVEPGARPAWLAPFVDALGTDIQRRINSAAAAGPVNLLGLVLLATPKQAMLESDLVAQLELYRGLLKRLEYAPEMTVTELDGAEIIAHGEHLGLVTRRSNPLGDVIHMTEEQAVLATYYRNNCMHLLALPALLACCFVNNHNIDLDDLRRIVRALYPYLAAELFLRWNEDELDAVLRHILAVMSEFGLIRHQRLRGRYRAGEVPGRQPVRLAVLARLIEQTLERFYVVVALLLRHGSGRVTEKALGEECHLMAQRLSLLFTLDSPEFFDRSLFRNLIQLMKQRGVLDVDAEGFLVFGPVVHTVDENAGLVLREEVRASIRQVTAA